MSDEFGFLTAELRRNEWKVAPPPGIWDRNYNDTSLEVRNRRGRVILQIRLLPDRVQMQWEWWGQDGRGVRCVSSNEVNKPGAFFLQISSSDLMENNEIQPLFAYPSDLHLGEFAK